MLLSVQSGLCGVHFDLSCDVSIDSFFSRLPLWTYSYCHVSKPFIYGEFPIKILNSVLPAGVKPCQFVWDMFVTALSDLTFSRY